MEEKRYLISDAARESQVEPHVLRYWEEELNLPIQRNEQGHRYYTEEDIQTFQNIKELKERGFQLKAIKVLLPELQKHSAKPNDNIISLEQKLSEHAAQEQKSVSAIQDPGSGRQTLPDADAHQEPAVPPDVSNVTILPVSADLDRLQQFEGIMADLFRQTLQDNNAELETRISDAVLKGMDMLMQLREEKEEVRFRRLDESIRSRQKGGRLAAAAREPGGFHPFRRHSR